MLFSVPIDIAIVRNPAILIPKMKMKIIFNIIIFRTNVKNKNMNENMELKSNIFLY